MQYVAPRSPDPDEDASQFFERAAAGRRARALTWIGGCATLLLAAAALAWIALAVQARGALLQAQAEALERAARQLAELEEDLPAPTAFLAPPPACPYPCDANAVPDDREAEAQQQALLSGVETLRLTLKPRSGLAGDAHTRALAAAHAAPRLRQSLVQAQAGALRRIARHEAAYRHAVHGLLVLLALASGSVVLHTVGRLRCERRWLDAGRAAEQAARLGLLSDALTQLPNRRALALHLPRMLGAAQRAGRPLALLAIDLDGFRRVNARHGRAAGDELLRNVAQRLYAHLRDADVVTRLEADRFVVALEAAESRDAAFAVAERIRGTLGEPVRLTQSVDPGAPRVSLRASVGLALYPRPARSVEELLQCADEALQQAKRGGGDRTVVAGEPACGEDDPAAPPSALAAAALAAAGAAAAPPAPACDPAPPTTLQRAG